MTKIMGRWKLFAIAIALPLFIAQPVFAHPGHGTPLETLIGHETSPSLRLAGLGIAFAIGAGHAFSPGHGKTMVAAYLVGSRGTPQHALWLGLITTMTHTFGVFVLGLLALWMSPYISSEQLYPILSLFGGLIIFLLGLRLLQLRLKEKGESHSHHPHPHRSHDGEPHSHHPHHAVELEKEKNWRSLLALGVAGGLVPCPSALVLLLSAIALQQTAYGMLLISSFSLGLASVLIAIGLATVYSRQWLEKMPKLQFLRHSLPLFSAAAIAWIGLGLMVLAIV
ncbi:MAG: sulfite exporter TauE/SafE family protein [Cyanobacteriota bacterium]|nr:sulfite exporter TauE/SafE family protein [Cyanobacteriota bacterium]